MTWNLESNHNALSEIANDKINSWETSRMTEVLPMISLLKLKHGDLTELRPSLEYARNDLELAPIVLNIAADEMLQSSQVLLDLGPEIFELIDKVMLKDDCSGLAFNSNSVFEKLMQIPYFRDRVIAQALSYSFSNQSTEISEKVLSKYLGPELISSHVIVESLSLPVSAYEKYWNSLDLISRRFELLRPQIRNLILPHLNSSSRHLSNALVLLRKVGTIQDSQAVMNLMTEASSSRNDCTFHEGFKTLGILGGSSQFVDWIWQYVEVEPTLVAAALSKTAFPDALPILLKAAGEISHYRPAKLNGSMFIPYGIEAEKALLKKLELLNGKGRQEILILLSEMGSSKGHQVVRQEFENSVHEGQFPPTGVVSALMIYGEDPWAELLNRLVDVNDGCNENMLKWFPETLKIKAAKRIGELMLQENDRIRFKKLQYWLNTDAFDEDQDYISEWVRLNHSNPKMRKLVIGR
jgi:hypothetical protein